MGNRYHQEDWQKDVYDRQRANFFPDTVRNEARFWRNLAATPWKASTIIGTILLAGFVIGGLGIFVTAGFLAGPISAALLISGTLLFAGLLFAGIAWGTRRSLEEASKSRVKDKQRPKNGT